MKTPVASLPWETLPGTGKKQTSLQVTEVLAPLCCVEALISHTGYDPSVSAVLGCIFFA